MISGLQNSLASVFRKALRFLGMANASTNDLPPFETMDTSGDSVQRYVSNLLNGYNAHGSARMDEYTVAELCHCKEETNVGHEYVTAKVVGPIPPFYLIFERFRGDENKDEPTTNTQEELGADARGERERLARRGILQTSSEVIRTSSDTSKEAFNIVKGSLSPWIISRNAIDRVSVSTGRTRPAKPPHFPSHVAHIATFADPIQLYKVAVLAVTIHHFADKYNVQYANCYFYAEVIMQVMKRLHHAEISTKSHPSWTPTGRLPMAKITPFPKVYNSLPTEEQICEIINSYRSELKDFEHKARTKDDQLASEAARADLEARGRAEEAARADLEARGRAEEAARADLEAQRRADEAARADQEAKKSRGYEAEIARLTLQLAAAKVPARTGAVSHV